MIYLAEKGSRVGKMEEKDLVALFTQQKWEAESGSTKSRVLGTWWILIGYLGRGT